MGTLLALLLAGVALPGATRSQEIAGGGGPPHGWAPYSGAFGMNEAAHLLRRTVVGPRFSEIREAESRGLAATLDLLFRHHEAAPPGDWTREAVPDFRTLTPAQRDSVTAVYRERQRLLPLWWTVQIVESPLDLTESMTLFWHDHFATAMRDVWVPQAMYGQHALFRKHAAGNFRALIGAVSRDPAMLIWLDGRTNIATEPNENFARELFELFTMGEGAGYTQDDVSEAARACTGWVTDGVRAHFVLGRHDRGLKTILGRHGPFGLDDLLDILLEEPATARHLCAKLYRWFFHAEPAAEDVEQLAALLQASGYEVEPVLRTMLSSEAFFDPAYRGALVKSGADLYAGALRTFLVEPYRPLVYPTQARFVLRQMEDYGQVLFDPPDVAGWPGHLHWINTQTLPRRKLDLEFLLAGRSEGGSLSMGIKVLDVTRTFTDPNDPERIVDDLALLWFGQQPTALVRQTMLDALLQGAEPYDWSIELPDARQRLEDLFRFAFRLPEGQLK